MANFELTLPAMGEGIIEATITKWLVHKGDRISVDQPLVEIATDKVDSEITSPVNGTIVKLIYHEGEIPRIGEIIAVIETNNHLSSHDIEFKPEKQFLIINREKEKTQSLTVIPVIQSGIDVNKQLQSNPFISPLIRTLAKQLDISFEELNKIKGTGSDNRVTRDDIHQYILSGRPFKSDNTNHMSLNNVTSNDSESIHNTSSQLEEGDEVVEMDRMRKIIADHMVRSKKIAPHVTSFAEADVSKLVEWREKNKEIFFAREKVKLTFTPVFVEVVARAIKDFPRINVTTNDTRIVLKKHINIGVATALADGNLIVPVVRNADLENLTGLAKIISDLAQRARDNKLQPAEIKGGTFTITNIGQYNNLTGTPIINQPECAILAVGTIQKKPWAVKTNAGYGIAVRDVTMLSLTYDHRVIDGALGGSFLSRIVYYLENFDTNLQL